MIINVTGPNGGRPYNNQVADKIRGAVAIMAVKLGIGHLPITYEVKLGNIPDKLSDDSRGLAIVDKRYNRYEAEIFVMREGKISDMISTLAHEMVHVKQFVKDGLDVAAAMYKGKQWTVSEGKDHYRDSPWEIEAHDKEITLTNHYLRYVEINKVK